MRKRRSIKYATTSTKEILPEHITQIDILKGLAIISIVLLHSWTPESFLLIGSPYHIWHAVPLLILIAGFTGAYAYKRRGLKTFGQCYDRSLLSRRLKRLIKPYAIYWLIQIAVLIIFFQFSFDLISLTLNFVSGGSGWGAYFVPVILQSVFVIPLLYLIAMRNPDIMVIIALAVDIIAESILLYSGVLEGVISVLYFRYLFAGALGVWLVTSSKRPRGWIALGAIISFIYITIICYTPLFSSITEFRLYEGILQAPAYMWTVLISMIGLLYFPKKAKTRIYQCLVNFGKASWHIFLVQMLYFLFLKNFVYYHILMPVYHSIPSSILILMYFLSAMIAIVFCCSIGFCWYIIEKKLSESNLPTENLLNT